jgi:type IV pilus assembly protein PilW
MKIRSNSRVRGLSLIELMVALAIGLVLSAIASSIFVSSIRGSRTQEERTKQDETAQIVMELLGRDLRQAGFYPAVAKEASTNVGFIQTFPNVVNVSWPAYGSGVFACSQGKFDAATGQCAAAGTAAEPDTLIVNYFSTDTFPNSQSGAGTRRNCLGQNADSAPHNQARAGAGANDPTSPQNTPVDPILVTNQYSLTDEQSYESGGRTIATRSFNCGSPGQTAQPFFQGVEQLRFRFGVIDATTLQAPASYLTAAQVSALPATPIGGVSLNGWQRVVSVEVCVLTRTLEFNVREAATTNNLTDCNNNAVALGAADRSLVSVSRKVFSVRNALGITL